MRRLSGGSAGRPSHIDPAHGGGDRSGCPPSQCRAVRAIVGPKVAIYGVVKADAYGHGAVAVAGLLEPLVMRWRFLWSRKAWSFAGAGITCPILVLGAYYGQTHSEVLEEGLTPSSTTSASCNGSAPHLGDAGRGSVGRRRQAAPAALACAREDRHGHEPTRHPAGSVAGVL